MSAIGASVRKELRALLPIWAACAAAFVLASRVETRYVPDLAPILFVFGCLALGAQSMGHEYAHGTVVLLLTQPIGRRRAFLIKTGVLAVLLAAFAAAAVLALVEGSAIIQDLAITPVQALTMTVLAALFITPYLTTVCRSGIAGFLFTGALVFIAGMIVTLLFGRWLGEGNGSAIHPAFWWPGTLLLSTLGAVGGWRLTTRLEVTGPGSPSIRLPFLGARIARETPVAPTTRHAVMWLLRKELRLQQMSFALAAVWAVCLAAIYVRGLFDPRFADGVLPLAFMAMGTLPVVIGSMASAEERQLGTLAWQQLVPFAIGQQWIVKAGVAFWLSLGLGLGIPAVALTLTGQPGNPRDWIAAALVVLVITGTALYVSSLTASAVRAVVTTVCVLVVGSLTIPWMLFEGARAFHPLPAAIGLPFPVALGLVTLPLLYFGGRNHASAEPPVDQLRRQIPWFAAALILSMLSMA